MREVRRFQRVLIVVFLSLNSLLLFSMKGLAMSTVVQYVLLTAILGTGAVLLFSRKPQVPKKR